jgi:hypothetical protein
MLFTFYSRERLLSTDPRARWSIPTSRRCGSTRTPTPSPDARNLPSGGRALMRIRTFAATLAAIVVLGAALAQSPAPAPLEARASDPAMMAG